MCQFITSIYLTAKPGQTHKDRGKDRGRAPGVNLICILTYILGYRLSVETK